ncbi:MAG TPA: choice-of-anchor tandem repeat GloVer-containing protein [Terriglobales bacterium]|nr:choice-of-anchor tandem repeat GloVer-containing protein [Terriglobales bacterium]
MTLIPQFAAVLLLSVCTCAQTYTYRVALGTSGRNGGAPISAVTIVGARGYGSAAAGNGYLYQAQTSGVSPETGCCASNAALAVDSSGNLYGEDVNARHAFGRVFGVKTGFKWVEKDLYDFTGNDGLVWAGSFPSGAPITESPVTLDASGDIWGVTYGGGPYSCDNVIDLSTCGVIFELTNNQGVWSESLIHAFSGPPDGAQPVGGLTFDPMTGTYYGVTQYGGDPVCNCGTVFQLTPNGDGTWSENIIYTFEGTGAGQPAGGLTLDAQGNLYGAFFGNLSFFPGEIYEISQGQFSILYFFSGSSDGANPNGSLVFDSFGNLWGTTYAGGANKLGTVFYLSPSENGWQETVLHSFQGLNGRPSDGQKPNTGLSIDQAGNLWGTTPTGGDNRDGTFYEVTVTK